MSIRNGGGCEVLTHSCRLNYELWVAVHRDLHEFCSLRENNSQFRRETCPLSILNVLRDAIQYIKTMDSYVFWCLEIASDCRGGVGGSCGGGGGGGGASERRVW